MSEAAADPEPPSRPRLNPFVFPSDTTFRFALLLVAVIGANLYIWNWLHTAVGDRSGLRLKYLICLTERQAAFSRVTDIDSYAAANDAFTACMQEANSSLPWWMLGGTALLLLVAVAILFLIPLWITRRRNLRPLTHEEAPGLVDELRGLARESGLDEEPRWVWNPLNPSPTGLAFGRPGVNAVALMGGLVTRQIADPPAFRAVVRHELAHVRNRDVDLTYATVSLWYAFLLVGALPFVITVAGEGTDFVVELSWRLLALSALVYLSRNAVLRAREVYADVRASVPDGPQGALRRILAGLPRQSTSLWRRLWRVHPDPQARLAAVNDTRNLFPVGLLVAFGMGIATTIAFESMVSLVGTYADDPIAVHMLAAAVFVPFTMAAVGVGIWRSSWGALAENRVPPSTWPFALALGAGLIVGPELALDRVVPTGEETLLGNGLGPGVAWIVALLVGTVLLLAWVAESAETWIRALAGSPRLRVVTITGLLVASGLLSMFVGVFFAIFGTKEAIGASREGGALEHEQVSQVVWAGPTWLWQLIRDAETLLVLTQPVVFAGLVALWLFPLAAWLWRRDRIADAPWAFLDAGGRLQVPLLGDRPSRDPLRIGLLGGAACLVAFLALRLVLRASVGPETRAEPLFPLAFFHYHLVIALVAQALAGAVATARGRASGMPLVVGLAAAFVTGAIATAGIALGSTAAGCIEPIAMNPGPCAWQVDASFSWLVLRHVVAEGAVAALASGLVVLAVRAVLGRRHAPPVPSTRRARARSGRSA